jgi:hypothetical protein
MSVVVNSIQKKGEGGNGKKKEAAVGSIRGKVTAASAVAIFSQ